MSCTFALWKDLEAWSSANWCQGILSWCFEFGTQEGIQNWIQAAVEECQGFRNGDPFMHYGLQAAAVSDDSQQDEGVDADADIIWQPAGKEGKDEDNCGLQGFALLVAFGVWQLGYDNTVASQNY